MKICPAYKIQSIHWTYQIGLSIQQETKKQGQNYCYEKGKGFTLAFGWEASLLFSEGLILQLILAGKTFNSFLLDGIKKILTKYKNLMGWPHPSGCREFFTSNIYSNFQASVRRVDVFYKSICPYVCVSVCLCVCLSVCVFTFEVLIKRLFCPHFQM